MQKKENIMQICCETDFPLKQFKLRTLKKKKKSNLQMFRKEKSLKTSLCLRLTGAQPNIVAF